MHGSGRGYFKGPRTFWLTCKSGTAGVPRHASRRRPTTTNDDCRSVSWCWDA